MSKLALVTWMAVRQNSCVNTRQLAFVSRFLLQSQTLMQVVESFVADSCRYPSRVAGLTVAAGNIVQLRSVGSLVHLGSDLTRGTARMAA